MRHVPSPASPRCDAKDKLWIRVPGYINTHNDVGFVEFVEYGTSKFSSLLRRCQVKMAGVRDAMNRAER